MRKNEFISIHILMMVTFLMYSSQSMSQNTRTTWQEQIEYAIANPKNSDDLNHLNPTKYIYKGVIDSDAKKSEIVEMIFSEDAPAVLNYPPIIKKDTVNADDSCVINEIRIPVYKVIPISEMKEILKSMGGEDYIVQVKEELLEIIKIGYGYVEIEWDYNGKKLNSICIVSNDVGGIVYDNIASYIISGTSKTSQKQVINDHYVY